MPPSGVRCGVKRDSRRFFLSMSALTWLMSAVSSTLANNLLVTNTTVTAPSTLGGAARISFDISWENSWRYTNATDDAFYHDAAWVFFKAASDGIDIWQHVVLSGTGTNPAGFSRGTAGADIEMIVPSDGMGVFIRRSSANLGHGVLASTGIEVLWDPAASSISPNSKVRARTMAIEMVYIAEGQFWAGDGVSVGAFTPTRINTSVATNAPVSIGGGEYEGGYPQGQTAPTNIWPNGYRAFYLMKYQGTQGQYKDFLNTLTELQARFRTTTTVWGPGENTARHTISGFWPTLACTAPDRACAFAHWADGAAYFDWAGLRPFTELEYEKACRGTNIYLANEYAWGTATLTNMTAEIGDANSGTNTPSPETANVNISGGLAGTVRVGIFAARPGVTRTLAGAGFWGNMELSGNVQERIVTINNAQGRVYTGLHGDGKLSTNGNANVANWPDTVSLDGGNGSGPPVGPGYRGSSYHLISTRAMVSDRGYAGSTYGVFTLNPGFRGARTAP